MMLTDPGVVLDFDVVGVLQLLVLGLAGGVLSGLMGSGGAFLMVPGMLSIGLPGPVAVGTSLLHKFGRALINFRRPLWLAPIDRPLLLLLLLGLGAGVTLGAFLLAPARSAAGGVRGSLYVSAAYACFMLPVAVSFLRERARLRRGGTARTLPSGIVRLLSSLRLPPVLDFKTAETRVSLPLILATGVIVGWVAGTVGILTFFLVPAMVYLLGVPRPMIARIEAALAVLLGALGASCYAAQGVVDVRVAMVLFAGSLVGVPVGRAAGHSMREVDVHSIAGCAILGAVASRLTALPVYAGQLGWLPVPAGVAALLGVLSATILAGSAAAAIALTIVFARRSRRDRQRVESCLLQWCGGEVAQAGNAVLVGEVETAGKPGGEA